MSRYILVLIFVCIIISCQKATNEKNDFRSIDQQFKLDLSDATKASAKDIFRIKRIIDLSGISENVFIKSIDQFIDIDSTFIILDKSLSNIFHFKKNGEFIGRIGKRGGGPNEYRKINDLFYDENESEVNILSNIDQTIITYSLNGDFKKRTKLDFFTNAFSVGKNFFYFDLGYDSPDNFNLIKTDKELNQLNSYFPFPDKTPIMSFEFSGGINHKGHFLTYTEATSSIIFQLDDGIIKPKYDIKIDENTWNYKYRHDFLRFDKALLNFNVSYLENSYLVLKDGLIFEYFQNKFMKRAYFQEDKGIYTVEGNLDRLFSMPIGLSNHSEIVAFINPEIYQSLKRYSKNTSNDLYELSPILYNKLEKINKDKVPESKLFLITYVLR